MKILAQLMNTVTAVIIGRFIGARLYGAYSYSMAWISIVTVFTMFGIDNSMLYLYSKYNQDASGRNKLVSFALMWVVFLSSLVILMVLLERGSLNAVIEMQYMDSVKTLIPLVLMLSVNQVLYSVFRSVSQVRVSVFINDLVFPLLKLTVIVSALMMGYQTQALAYSIYIAVMICLVLYCLAVVQLKPFRIERPHKAIAVETLKYSWPLFFSGAIVALLARMDVLFLGRLANTQSVGIYNIVFQITILLSFINNAVGTVYAPMISSHYHAGNIHELKIQYKKVSFAVFYITLLFFAPVAVFSREILSIFGAEFVIGSTALIILSIGQLVNNYASMAGYMNSMTGHPEYSMYDGVAALFINGGLNLLLIPKIGMAGAALASLCTILFRSVFHQLMVYKNMRISIFSNEHVKAGTIITLSSIVLIVMKSMTGHFNLLAQIIICGSIYVLSFALLTVKIIDIKDIMKNS